MKFFIKKDQCQDSCYYEFYKGKWDSEAAGREDSIYLHEDILYDGMEFAEAIKEVIPDYNQKGNTEVSVDEWLKIGQIVKEKDVFAREIYQDADMWVQLACVECGCVTILGV